MELNFGPGKTMAIPVNSKKEDFLKKSGIPVGKEYKYLGLRLRIEDGQMKIKEAVEETILKRIASLKNLQKKIAYSLRRTYVSRNAITGYVIAIIKGILYGIINIHANIEISKK